jgi:hypothetical protein
MEVQDCLWLVQQVLGPVDVWKILFWIGIGRLIQNIPINNTAQNAIKAKNREVNCTKLQGRATAIQVTPIKEAQEAQ